MKGFLHKIVCAAFVLIVVASSVVSCSDDADTPTIELSTSALIVDTWGQSATARISGSNIASISISDVPDGWSVTADIVTMTVTATAPATETDDEDEAYEDSATVTLTAVSLDGVSTSVSVFIGIRPTIDLSDSMANCLLISQPNTRYTFPTCYRGEVVSLLDGTADVEILWTSSTSLISYLSYDSGTVSFYVGADSDGELVEGNMLLGAYDADGTLLWSWHLWITSYPAAEGVTLANGDVIMGCNLGARANDNDSKGDILKSYGLYYQWGRKDPFTGPSTYNCAGGIDAYMYNGSSSSVYVSYPETTSEIGTEDYAREYPMHFITGIEESDYDWLYAKHDGALWDEQKTVNDPCPKGWRVPSKETFEMLAIVDDLTSDAGTYAEKFGWTLSDGAGSSFFVSAGHRTYLTGRLQNVYAAVEVETPRPWIGCYWTVDAAASNWSSAMYFWLDQEDASASGVQADKSYQRAEGMQVRCVKMK